MPNICDSIVKCTCAGVDNEIDRHHSHRRVQLMCFVLFVVVTAALTTTLVY